MSGLAIEMRPATMRCDTPACGYELPVEARDVRKYVGALCPRCSAVMVTEDTAKSIEASLAVIDAINSMGFPVEDGPPHSRATLRIDNAGGVAEFSLKKLDADTA